MVAECSVFRKRKIVKFFEEIRSKNVDESSVKNGRNIFTVNLRGSEQGLTV